MANLEPRSQLWTNGPPAVVGELPEHTHERRQSDPLIYSQWAGGRKGLPFEGLAAVAGVVKPVLEPVWTGRGGIDQKVR